MIQDQVLHLKNGQQCRPAAFESDLDARRRSLLSEVETFANEVARRPDSGETTAPPFADLERLKELGVLTAPLPVPAGGLDLTEPDRQSILLRLLAAIGGADLVLGRLLEGHINALLLIQSFGSPAQKLSAAADAHAGLLFGVWNTGAKELLLLEKQDGGYVLRGVKTFASGASFVKRPIVTAELPQGGWQMTLPRMDEAPVANALKMNRAFWQPLGMEGSESLEVDFTDARLSPEDLIGAPGDFYRDPLFRGGAIRFASVHVGAILRLQSGFAAWLRNGERGNDPYQIARLGETVLLAREAALWLERAGVEAAAGMQKDSVKHVSERMVEFANAMRIAVERCAAEMMRHVTLGIGAHGLLRPHRFGRILRDLTMYLRQPAPDQTLAELGRAALRNMDVRSDGALHGLWSDESTAASMPPSYFDEVYDRSSDPWNFETSPYEAAKYDVTLEALPKDKYRSGLEVGCSIGVLTQKLAGRCDSLLSVDVSEKALEIAKERCSDLPQVRFECRQIPGDMPDGDFDLAVLSEVAYYWGRKDQHLAADQLAKRQAAGSHLLLVHFTEHVPDYPLTGDQVHDLWLSRPEWRSVHGSRHERYRLDLLERR